MSLPPAAIITDIEGTTTPIDFVHKTLFPYARARLAAFCEAQRGQQVLADVPEPVLDTLLGWMDRDEKITALKTVQGMIWEEGYRAGTLKSVIYPDVAPALKRWSQGGLRLFVYSSGSVPAQKLLFGHSDAGRPDAAFFRLFRHRHRREARRGELCGDLPRREFVARRDAVPLRCRGRAGRRARRRIAHLPAGARRGRHEILPRP